MHVRVDTNTDVNPVCCAQRNEGHLRPHPRQRNKLIQCTWYIRVVLFLEYTGGRCYELCLVVMEPDLADQAVERRIIGLQDVVDCETMRLYSCGDTLREAISMFFPFVTLAGEANEGKIGRG